MTYQKWVGWKEQTKQVACDEKTAIIRKKAEKGTSCVQTIGKIEVEKYRCVSESIRTSEVIITDERIGHIMARHPNDYERYAQYITKIVESPDYILEEKKPNTAFLLKEFVEDGERFQLILRLAVEGDKEGYKNSVITFLKVEEKRYKRYLRTKKSFTNLNKATIIGIEIDWFFEVDNFVASTRRWY